LAEHSEVFRFPSAGVRGVGQRADGIRDGVRGGNGVGGVRGEEQPDGVAGGFRPARATVGSIEQGSVRAGDAEAEEYGAGAGSESVGAPGKNLERQGVKTGGEIRMVTDEGLVFEAEFLDIGLFAVEELVDVLGFVVIVVSGVEFSGFDAEGFGDGAGFSR